MLSQHDGTPHAQKSLRLEVPLLLQRKFSSRKMTSDDYQRPRKIQETKNKDQINARNKFFSSQRER